MGSRLYSFKIHVFYFSGFLFALLPYFCFPFCCQLVASFIYFQKFELIGFQNTRRRRDQWVSFVPHQALIPASLHTPNPFLPSSSILLNACARPLRLRLRLGQASNVNAAAISPLNRELECSILDPPTWPWRVVSVVNFGAINWHLRNALCYAWRIANGCDCGCVGCNFNQGATG